MGNMAYPGYYAYSMGGSIASILTLLIRVFAYTAVLAVAFGLFIWIRNNYFENEHPQNQQNENDTLLRKDTALLKGTAVIGTVVIGIVLLCALLNTFGRNGMNYGYGISSIYVTAAILILIVKVLVVVLAISIVMAAVTMIKDQYDRERMNIFKAGNEKQI